MIPDERLKEWRDICRLRTQGSIRVEANESSQYLWAETESARVPLGECCSQSPDPIGDSEALAVAWNEMPKLLDEIEALRKALSLAREGLFIGLQCGQQSRDEYRDVKEAIAAVDAALYPPPPPSRSAPDTETEPKA